MSQDSTNQPKRPKLNSNDGQTRFYLELPKNQTKKIVFKNGFGNFTIDMKSSITNRIIHPNMWTTQAVYSGQITVKPQDEQILENADRIQILIHITGPNPDGDPLCSFEAKHIENGIFNFSIDIRTNEAKYASFNVSIRNTEEPSESKTSRDYLKKLLHNSQHTDFIIKTSDQAKEIKVHKIIIMRSEFFSNVLNCHSREAQTGVIEVTEDYAVMYELCRYLYYDRFNKSEVIPLMIAADKYQIKNLFLECKKYLMKNITMDNCVYIYYLTKIIVSEDLKAMALKTFNENRLEILSSERWKEAKKVNVEYALNLMEEAELLIDRNRSSEYSEHNQFSRTHPTPEPILIEDESS
ncbi:hypothetical protein PVAND_005334 [Polypedilum vanderplanki]|uniref:BTB domain-containing protein n=1 Tax=Polypedilum vanderplanki TaxID=319348 RepID=A0A9J6C0Q2_POLVA|nr:hypothetical protein PVAND_005334 [Polypedilum vanderplanki]